MFRILGIDSMTLPPESGTVIGEVVEFLPIIETEATCGGDDAIHVGEMIEQVVVSRDRPDVTA